MVRYTFDGIGSHISSQLGAKCKSFTLILPINTANGAPRLSRPFQFWYSEYCVVCRLWSVSWKPSLETALNKKMALTWILIKNTAITNRATLLELRSVAPQAPSGYGLSGYLWPGPFTIHSMDPLTGGSFWIIQRTRLCIDATFRQRLFIHLNMVCNFSHIRSRFSSAEFHHFIREIVCIMLSLEKRYWEV